ncbi:ras association domain-containing protein 9-like [Arapaima gigas]
MAPFGRSLLRARLKRRSKDHGAPPAGAEVPVWVCEEEKAVCGATKRTTCEEVVQALLEDLGSSPEDGRVLQGEPSDYCLVERWRGFERALPPLTRILRLWEAWGDEQPEVRFVLVNSKDVAARAAYHRGPSKPWARGAAQYVGSLPEERRRRAVRKAFRKLERIRRERRPQRRHGIDKMVQLIITQDHTIQQQVHRTRELDLEIERIERLLQPACEYSGTEWEDTVCGDFAEGAVGPSQDSLREEYLSACGRLSQLDLQVEMQWELIKKLTCDIDAETQQVCRAESQGPPGVPANVGPGLKGPQEAAELGRMTCDLERCVLYGLTLQAQAVELQGELQRSEAALCWGHQECENLAAQLSALRVEDGAEPAGAGGGAGLTRPPTELTDTDSDTGISSTHSQDSLTPCGELPPPLDTDL